jgi:hypothetical protein
MTEREIRGLFTLLELSLNQTIDGLRATLNTIDQYKRGGYVCLNRKKNLLMQKTCITNEYILFAT